MNDVYSIIDLSANTMGLELVSEREYSLTFSLEEVRWHPTRNYILAFTEAATYIADVDSQTLRGLPNCVARQPTCIGWLPTLTDEGVGG